MGEEHHEKTMDDRGYFALLFSFDFLWEFC